MLPKLPVTTPPEALDTLKRLHARFTALDHHLAWFIDLDGRARLLVSVVTGRQTVTYQIDGERHVVSVPDERRSAELDISVPDVQMLGVEGLLCHIEKQLGFDLELGREVAAFPERRAA